MYLVTSCFIPFKLKIIAYWMFSPQKGEGRRDKEMEKRRENRKGKFLIKDLRASSFLKFLGLFWFRFFCLFYLTFPTKQV